MQNYIFDKLMEAGAEFDIKPFGIKAMTLMALEKSYKLIPRELSIEYNAYESGLDRFISLKKPGFLGKDGLLAKKDAGLANQLVTLEVLGVTDADARGSEPVYLGNEIVGRVTSGSRQQSKFSKDGQMLSRGLLNAAMQGLPMIGGVNSVKTQPRFKEGQRIVCVTWEGEAESCASGNMCILEMSGELTVDGSKGRRIEVSDDKYGTRFGVESLLK